MCSPQRLHISVLRLDQSQMQESHLGVCSATSRSLLPLLVTLRLSLPRCSRYLVQPCLSGPLRCTQHLVKTYVLALGLCRQVTKTRPCLPSIQQNLVQSQHMGRAGSSMWRECLCQCWGCAGREAADQGCIGTLLPNSQLVAQDVEGGEVALGVCNSKGETMTQAEDTLPTERHDISAGSFQGRSCAGVSG